MRLGRLPHSPAALAAVPPHIRSAAMPVPARLDRSGVHFAPGLYGNDLLPDCTAAGLANAASAVAAVYGYDLVIDPDKVKAFYASCVGVPASDAAMEATDGAQMIDVLNRARIHGFDIGGQVPLTPTCASIRPDDRLSLAHTMAVHGAVYAGVGLALADQDATVWDTETPGDQTINSWGGHCVTMWDYDGLGDVDLVWVATWGALHAATWRWVQARLEEAFALTWPQIIAAPQS